MACCFVAEGYRDQGLGKWLVACIIAHPDLQSLRIFLLATRDAHELYRRYGAFEALPAPDRLMARRRLWGRQRARRPRSTGGGGRW